MPLISKDELIKTSMVNIGYLILKSIDKSNTKKQSLTEITNALQSDGINEYRPIMFALCFLYISGAIEFDAPYIYLLDPNATTS